MAGKRDRVLQDMAINLEGDAIKVIVGSQSPATFVVHEALIRGSSDFFDKPLGNAWKEAAEWVMKLPEDNPDIFRLYMQWLYCDTVPTKAQTPKSDEYMRLAEAYVLGDKLQDTGFCDAVMDATVNKFSAREPSEANHLHPSANTIKYVYDNTVPSSKLRKVYATFHAFHATSQWHNKWAKANDLPKDFFIDLALAFMNKSSTSSPRKLSSTCKYHRYGATPCYEDPKYPRKRLNKA